MKKKKEAMFNFLKTLFFIFELFIFAKFLINLCNSAILHIFSKEYEAVRFSVRSEAIPTPTPRGKKACVYLIRKK